MNAFEKYLRSLAPTAAARHLVECLQAQGDAAYELFEKVHGDDWSLNRDSLGAVLDHIYKDGE